jgi:hypothetical protein
MKYTVGMIVTIRSDKQLAGVIIGWQHKELEPCDVSYSDIEDPILDWYSVLCEDEKLHYQSEGM